MTKILIVDDEPACRDSLCLLLSLESFEVEVAADGRAALEVATRQHPDVLLVDWMLDDHQDGLQVAEAIRAINPKLQTIVITGFPTPELEARVKAATATELLEKSSRPGDLLAAVKRAADRCG